MATSFQSRVLDDATLTEEPASLVDPATYSELAVSHRRLERYSDIRAGVVGLRDLETGERFMIETRTLVGYGLSNGKQ